MLENHAQQISTVSIVLHWLSRDVSVLKQAQTKGSECCVLSSLQCHENPSQLSGPGTDIAHLIPLMIRFE